MTPGKKPAPATREDQRIDNNPEGYGRRGWWDQKRLFWALQFLLALIFLPLGLRRLDDNRTFGIILLCYCAVLGLASAYALWKSVTVRTESSD